MQARLNKTSSTDDDAISLTDLFTQRIRGEQHFDVEAIDNILLVKALSGGVQGAVLRKLTQFMPKDVVMGAVGTDLTNFSKLVKRKRLTSMQTEELNDLTLLWKELNTFFDNDDEMVSEWINARLPAFEGETPKSLMKSQYGRRVVRDVLDTMRYGDFA